MNYRAVLDEKGVLNISNVLDAKLIEQARNAVERSLEETSNRDVLLTSNQTVRKICYAFDKNDVFLDIIAHPNVIGILKGIYGKGITSILPTWEDAIVKAPKAGVSVEIHQDLGLGVATEGVFSLAFQLHDTSLNPVCFLEGSHKLGPLTREEIKDYQNKELYKPYLSLAGDVDVHNAFTLHYSAPNKNEYPRYTWYVEFRTMRQVEDGMLWSKEWALKRQAILLYAIENRKRKGLPFEEIEFEDKADLIRYLENIELRVPHESEGVRYVDYINNEYNHFADHKE